VVDELIKKKVEGGGEEGISLFSLFENIDRYLSTLIFILSNTNI